VRAVGIEPTLPREQVFETCASNRAEAHKLYACHDRLLEHKDALFAHLVGRWRDLFNASFDVLLYALSHQVKRCLQVLLILFTSLAVAKVAR
jgi:hypothetical protein